MRKVFSMLKEPYTRVKTSSGESLLFPATWWTKHLPPEVLVHIIYIAVSSDSAQRLSTSKVWKMIKRGVWSYTVSITKISQKNVSLLKLLYLILTTLWYVSRFGPLNCLAYFMTVLSASLGYTAAQWACVYRALEGPQMESEEKQSIFLYHIFMYPLFP